MARDTITARLELAGEYETIQAIRQALVDQTAQAELVSLISETATTYLADKTGGVFEMRVALKISPVCQTRRGPRLPVPKVENGLLSWYDPYADITNTVGEIGSADWLDWLEKEGAKSFRYESDLGSFTAIKENRRGRPVWYAHRRRAGQLKRVYLGQAENLTAAKLAETARTLNSKEVISLTGQ
jgi:hypothetical protein